MKNLNKLFLITIITIISALFISCYTPSPLYGTWADNLGNKMVFNEDGTFSATIFNGEETKFEFDGTWTTIDNSILLKYKQKADVENTEVPEISRIAEWDIQGAKLTVKWTINEQISKNLILWHTER